MTKTTKWLAGSNVVLGLWMLVAPAVLEPSVAGMWNDVLVGSLVALLGAYNLYRTTQGNEVSRGVASINALAGLWLLTAPFVLTGIGGLALWNDVTVGLLIAIFGGYNAYVSKHADTRTSGHQTA